MNRIAMPSLILVVLLAGCNRTPEPEPEPAAPPPAADTATTAAPAAEAPETAVATGEASWQGYGPLPLGIDAAQMRALWPGELQGDAAADGGCYYLSPASEEEARPFFMIEGDRFVRYDLRSSDAAAPGGGAIGMDLPQLQALYPNAAAPQPHKYVDGGKVLRVPAVYGSQAVLVLELGADGKVSAWRVGLPPQVDYVEGCG